MVAQDVNFGDDTASSKNSKIDLSAGSMIFVPNGLDASISGNVIRFCYADASNLNRVKQHLRVEALVNNDARAWLSTLQSPTFVTTMTRCPSLSTWSAFRTWPRMQKIAKESELATKALSRRERYKIWQDDRKWDQLVAALTLPVSRPPLIANSDSDIFRNTVVLTWQDVYQSRKGDITRFGYLVTWRAEDSSSMGEQNVTSFVRSALPTTFFGGDFDGKAVQATIEGLQPNTSYTFMVGLYVGDVIGLYSERSQVIQTLPCTPPSSPVGLTFVSLATNAVNCVQLTWEPPEDTGGVAIESYVIGGRYSRNPETNILWSIMGPDELVELPVKYNIERSSVTEKLAIAVGPNVSGKVCNLRSGVTYQFQVAATNVLGMGGFGLWTDPVGLPKHMASQSRQGMTHSLDFENDFNFDE
jgi:hypothetical protein